MRRLLSRDLLLVVVGNLILAFSVTYFVLPNNILSGGVAGIANAIYPLFHIPKDYVVYGLVIGLFVIGYLFLGKRFALRTLISSIVYPGALFVMQRWLHPVPVQPLLASVYGGLLGGIGVGLVFRVGASTGGMDIPPLILAKWTHTKISGWVMMFDALTVMLGLLSYSVEDLLIGFISIWVSSQAIDRMMVLGGFQAKTVYIISSAYQTIIDHIHEELNRGTTLVKAYGGYTKEEHPMIMSVVMKREYPDLEKLVMHLDPNAFMIVSDATEVHGEGFNHAYRM